MFEKDVKLACFTL